MAKCLFLKNYIFTTVKDQHDVTEFMDELEEVTEPVFKKDANIHLTLDDNDIRILKKIAKQLGKKETELVSEWIHHKIHELI